MNLLEILSKEIENLKLKNKYFIARYIYIRLGELFNYDPLYIFGNEKEKEFIKNKRINIHNVTDFNLTCMAWSHMYVELLKVFQIEAEVIKNDIHAAVVILIDNKKFLADLTNANEDITNIKFGLPIKNFYQIYKNQNEKEFEFEKIDDELYTKGIKAEEVLTQLKQELQFIRRKLNKERYDYFIFKLLEKIMNFERPNVGFVSGVTYINNLIKDLSSNDTELIKNHFINKENENFIEVFKLITSLNNYYFVYQKNNKGFYELHEQPEEKIKILLRTHYLNNITNFENNSFSSKYN